MIVRIINDREGSDKFYDCRNTCVLRSVGGRDETVLIIEFRSDRSIKVVLNLGDEIYYMNDIGKTVHVDRRVYKEQ